MKAVCPYCGAHTPVTWEQADSGKPIACVKCGKNVRDLGVSQKGKGETK